MHDFSPSLGKMCAIIFTISYINASAPADDSDPMMVAQNMASGSISSASVWS